MNVDALKIDQSFVRELPGSAEDATIVAAIIAMAAQFRIKVVAEGVETQAQLEVLRQMNCTEGQGFLFSPALPRDEFEQRYLRPA
jgi:EAL domain-containing protein (putative c-di-GMP-specific phosphodiesterase class I)